MASKGESRSNNEVMEDIELQDVASGGDIGTSSSNSGLSSILETLSEISEQRHQRGLYEDQPEESANLLNERLNFLTKSAGTRKKCYMVFAVVFVGWLVALITYSQTTKSPYQHKGNSRITHQESNSTSHEVHHPSTSSGKLAHKRKITLNDYRMGNFYVFNTNVKFVGNDHYIVPGNRNYFYRELGHDEKSEQLFASSTFEYGPNSYQVSDFQVSPSQDYILIITDQELQWRHSSFSNYWIFNMESKNIEPLYQENVKLSNAQWSPTGEYVSFVFENNLFVKNIESSTLVQVTQDGSFDIFNGKPDWVYEEEVLSSDKSIWWAPNSEKLMFMRLDDTDVPIQNLEFFVQDNPRYPVIEEIKYPKPGFPNPKPTLVVYDLPGGRTFPVPESEFGPEFVLYSLKFINNDEIMIKESDRESNVMNVNIFNTTDRTLTKVRQIKASDYGGWIEKPGPLVLVDRDGHQGYIDTVVYNNYKHLLYFQNTHDAEPQMLTSGAFDIGEEYSYNLELDEVYLTSTLEHDPLSHHLFKIEMSNEFRLQNLTNVDEKLYYEIIFNNDTSFASLNYRGPEIPFQKLVQLKDFNMERYLTKDRLLNNNLIATSAQSRFEIPLKTFGNITYDDIEYQYIEMKPFNFDPNKKYPLLVSVYGGPGSIKLSNTYNIGFEEVVCSSLDLIIIYLDPRGTGGKGWGFKRYSNQKIGHWEPRDFTDLTKILMLNKQYIDKERTAIWGWSYGGFSTLKTLEYDAGNIFKYGMAVAPVTDWLFYDSIYTERFMNKPENNEAGYEESRINNIDNFKKVKRFLVMHGTGDDNVHLQNTLSLLDQFDLHSVENYDMHIFPDSNHSIYYNNANAIVYDKLFNWLRSAFNRGV